jgi:hypothetical protein
MLKIGLASEAALHRKAARTERRRRGQSARVRLLELLELLELLVLLLYVGSVYVQTLPRTRDRYADRPQICP